MNDPASFVRFFLSRHIPGRTLGEDENIFDAGFVTSLLAMQLVTLIEKRFDIVLDDDDLQRDNFQSISAITSLIERIKSRLSSASTGAVQ